MKFIEAYFKLNWTILNEQGLQRTAKGLLIDEEGCSLIKKISCPYTLSFIVFMCAHDQNSMFYVNELYNHFFDDTRSNLFYFETVLERLIEESIIMQVE